MGEGEGGLNREGGLTNFPPLKRGGLIGEGGLNRGFTVYERGGIPLVEVSERVGSLSLCSLKSPKRAWGRGGVLLDFLSGDVPLRPYTRLNSPNPPLS